MNTFATLLKREFWEHQGGMLWAPLAVGGLMLAVAFASILVGLVLGQGQFTFDIQGARTTLDGLAIPPEIQAGIAASLALATIPLMLPLAAVLAFVLLFYALGSLYDERRDRSLLFWKSMPVSDTTTVLSKLVSMALIAPSITVLVGAAVGSLIPLLAAIAMIGTGTDVLPTLLTTADFYLAPLALLALVPVYALWALPSIAWCMVVSAWARRAPVLWALGMPVLVGILLSWQQAIFDRNIGADWFWEHVVGRLFGGFVPGMWFVFTENRDSLDRILATEGSLLGLVGQSYVTLASPALWIGLIVATGLLVLAIRLRRWREDAA